MADSAVVVTSGTGTNIDTRTEATNGHHRQVVVLGDPATNAGVASVDATAGLKVDLGADNDVTVAGVSTAAKQDTIIGHVDGIEADTTTIAGDTTSIDAKIPALGQALAAASTPVVLTAAQITTLTPPAAITGFGTSANQTTIIGHLDGVEGLLTTMDADTGTIATEVAGLLTDTELRATPVPVSGTVAVTNAGITTIAGAVAGTEMQVDVLTMPTTAVTGTFWQATQPVSLTSTTVTGTVAVTQSGTWDEVGINDSGNSITVDYATTGSGTSTGALRVELPTNGTGTVGLNAGTNAIGKLAANSGVDIGDVDVTSISAGSNLIGDVGIQGRTTGGLTIFRSIDLDETEEEVKATAGTIYGIYAINLTAAPLYLKIYDLTAANTTVGTSTPVLTFPIVANADSDGAGFVLNIVQGIAFSTAISAAVTTGIADADVGAPGANQAIVQIFYK